MYFHIIKAEYKENYIISLQFKDGSSGVVDLASYAEPNTVFQAFLNLNYFKQFTIEYGTLVWGNGEVDIAPETLYEAATGKKIKYKTLDKSA